jgi:hypothetical protein
MGYNAQEHAATMEAYALEQVDLARLKELLTSEEARDAAPCVAVGQGKIFLDRYGRFKIWKRQKKWSGVSDVARGMDSIFVLEETKHILKMAFMALVREVDAGNP